MTMTQGKRTLLKDVQKNCSFISGVLSGQESPAVLVQLNLKIDMNVNDTVAVALESNLI